MNELMRPRRNRRRLLEPFWNSISSMEKEMMNAFDDPFFCDAFAFTNSRTSVLPKVNIKEDESTYNVEIAIPGIDKNKVNLKVENGNKLKISMEDKEENTDDKYLFREISKRVFHRVIPFPVEIDEKAKATYKNGIIEVVLTKKERTKESSATIEVE